jgi:hypothetical protein
MIRYVIWARQLLYWTTSITDLTYLIRIFTLLRLMYAWGSSVFYLWRHKSRWSNWPSMLWVRVLRLFLLSCWVPIITFIGFEAYTALKHTPLLIRVIILYNIFIICSIGRLECLWLLWFDRLDCCLLCFLKHTVIRHHWRLWLTSWSTTISYFRFFRVVSRQFGVLLIHM